MTPAVNPLQVLQAVDEWNFPWEAFKNLPRHRRSQGGGQNRPPNWNATNDKNKNNKAACFFQFF